ncbi:cobalamin biosynthesis protein [Streptomyces noursei]|uniref:cobalamin biosynthesis protein n=1 Tax=Streptomyces noursei TaxID=1971 RepID=UPI000C9CF055|nr:cobalamin biosynthesis protein [Streptomyces noursei]
MLELIGAALAAAGRAPAALAGLATVDAKAAEPGLVAAARELGVPLWSFPAAELAAVPVPAPSAAVRAVAGTPSVAEAAALLAAGPGPAGRRQAGVGAGGPAAAATCALAAPAAPNTRDIPAITSGTAGAADMPTAGPAIVIVPSPDAPAPPERLTPRSPSGVARRAAEGGGHRPDSEAPGTKETL